SRTRPWRTCSCVSTARSIPRRSRQPAGRLKRNRVRRGTRMFEVARYESERRAMLALTIVVAAAFYGTMFVAIAPSFTDLDLASLFAELPKQLTEGLGIESMNTLPGILAVELYQVGWLL